MIESFTERETEIGHLSLFNKRFGTKLNRFSLLLVGRRAKAIERKFSQPQGDFHDFMRVVFI